jgi:hypothetical protein
MVGCASIIHKYGVFSLSDLKGYKFPNVRTEATRAAEEQEAVCDNCVMKADGPPPCAKIDGNSICHKPGWGEVHHEDDYCILCGDDTELDRCPICGTREISCIEEGNEGDIAVFTDPDNDEWDTGLLQTFEWHCVNEHYWQEQRQRIWRLQK